jgi:hypothetical protein
MNESMGQEKPTLRLILDQAIGLLEHLDREDQLKALKMIGTYFEAETRISVASEKIRTNGNGQYSAPSQFSEDRTLSPKEFLFEKRPQTDVERVACLAYYLTHFRGEPHFKTFDLSKLNTEAAQIKFSNPAVAVDNAAKAGLLVPAVKGSKQLSSLGEVFVQELPDRVAAKEKLSQFRPRRKQRKPNTKVNVSDD